MPNGFEKVQLGAEPAYFELFDLKKRFRHKLMLCLQRDSLCNLRPKSALIIKSLCRERFLRSKIFKTKLAQRPMNRSQRSWTLFLTKIMSQIDPVHSKTMNMHPGAVADPVVVFCTNSVSLEETEKWVQISTDISLV